MEKATATKIISTSINLEDKKALYQMTMAPNRMSVQDIKQQTVMVTDWALYTDVDSKGEEKTVMSFSAGDGQVYTTISQSFIREFNKIIDLFGTPVSIYVDSAVGKNGREFIFCTLGE